MGYERADARKAIRHPASVRAVEASGGTATRSALRCLSARARHPCRPAGAAGDALVTPRGVTHAVPLPRSVRSAAPGLVAAERQEMRDTAGAVSREQSELDDGRRVTASRGGVLQCNVCAIARPGLRLPVPNIPTLMTPLRWASFLAPTHRQRQDWQRQSLPPEPLRRLPRRQPRHLLQGAQGHTT
jgi:hypothetical protein